MATKAKVTEEGLLIPKEVAERALGEGSVEVEISEEAGWSTRVAEGPPAERTVFVDTGYLLALERRSDENHRRASAHGRDRSLRVASGVGSDCRMLR